MFQINEIMTKGPFSLSKNEKSLGILGMEERVNILGGSFSIYGSSTQGTTINVEIPFSNYNIG